MIQIYRSFSLEENPIVSNTHIGGWVINNQDNNSGIIVDFKIRIVNQCVADVKMIKSYARDHYIANNSVNIMVCLHLKYYVQYWMLHLKKEYYRVKKHSEEDSLNNQGLNLPYEKKYEYLNLFQLRKM